jgi:cupin 2 domain-containing protein
MVVRPPVQNLFVSLSKAEHEEILTLFENSSAKIERIISHSHSSPPGFWYDQEWDEWVIVLRGKATLEFEGEERVELQHGDYLTIAKHVKHRVARTSAETIWLAVYVK